MNYETFNNQLTGRCKDSRKIGNNTYLKRRGENIAIVLHATDIITYCPDGTIILNSGGWRTVTTKYRLNRFLPCNIYQNGGIWYIGDWQKKSDNPIFEDGIKIDCNGVPIGEYKIDNKATIKQHKIILKQCKEYAQLVADSCPIDLPSSGDCWYCSLVEVESKRPLGEVTNNTTHLLGHFEEKYIVPSLVYKACKQYGISQMAGSYLQYGNQEGIGNSFDTVLKRQIQSAVYRYLKMQFGIAS